MNIPASLPHRNAARGARPSGLARRTQNRGRGARRGEGMPDASAPACPPGADPRPGRWSHPPGQGPLLNSTSRPARLGPPRRPPLLARTLPRCPNAKNVPTRSRHWLSKKKRHWLSGSFASNFILHVDVYLCSNPWFKKQVVWVILVVEDPR